MTGFLCLLVDMLLEPGGWIVLHDIDRTAAEHVRRFPKACQDYQGYTEAEMHMCQVRKAFEVLVWGRGYRNVQERDFEAAAPSAGGWQAAHPLKLIEELHLVPAWRCRMSNLNASCRTRGAHLDGGLRNLERTSILLQAAV